MPLDEVQTRSRTLGVAFFALTSQTGKGFFTVDRFNLATFNVVVTAIEHSTHPGQLFQVTDGRVLHKVSFRTTGSRGHLIQLGFQLRWEMYFHDRKFRRALRSR